MGRAKGFKYFLFSLSRVFFGHGVLVNKGVLLGDIGRGDFFLELLFPRSYFLVEWDGVGWLGKKGGGYSLLRTFFLSFSNTVT